MTSISCSLFDSGAATKYDQVSQRNLFTTGLRCIKFLLDSFQRLQNFCELRRIVYFPIFLGRQTYACTIGTATFVRAAES